MMKSRTTTTWRDVVILEQSRLDLVYRGEGRTRRSPNEMLFARLERRPEERRGSRVGSLVIRLVLRQRRWLLDRDGVYRR